MGKVNRGIMQPYMAAIGSRLVDMRAKDVNVNVYVRKWLSEAQTMLQFDGLPDTMPQRDIRKLLQTNGFMVLVNPKLTGGKLYAFHAGLGGEPDPYYMPTRAVIANPALDFSADLEIHKDAVVVPHDSMYMGLLPILNHYATLAVETDLSLYLATILSRAPVHISAQGTRSQASADEYLRDLEKGKLGAIFEDGFLDGIRSNPGASGTSAQSITDLIELRQYWKASRWNDIGLNANYNMKRESINAAEAQMDDDALMPFVQDIIQSIQTGLDEANAKGWCDLHVSLGGVWANRQRIEEATTEAMEAEADAAGSDPEPASEADPEPEEVKPDEN